MDARTKDWSAVLQESITGFDQPGRPIDRPREYEYRAVADGDRGYRLEACIKRGNERGVQRARSE